MKLEYMRELMVLLTKVEQTESVVITYEVNLNQTHQQSADEIEQQVAMVRRGLPEHQRENFDTLQQAMKD